MEKRRVTRMKRTVIWGNIDEEDEREGVRDEHRSRKINLRIKKTRYTEDDGDDGVEEEDMEEDEQPGPSTQNVHSHKENKSIPAKSIGLLAVTCGNKSGIMDVDMLQRAEDCIRYNDEWFSPPAFEELGGKASSKKWKSTIFYKDKPLQFWFEQGHLTTKGYKRRSSGIPKQIQTPPSSTTFDRSSEGLETQRSEPDDVNDHDWHPKNHKLEGAASESLAFSELTESGADTSKEEVDTGIEPELDSEEDEDMNADAGNIQTAEEREALKKSAQQMEPRVLIKRLLKDNLPITSRPISMASTDSQCNHQESTQDETEPLNEHRQGEENMEHGSSSIASNGEDKTRESSLRDDGRQGEIKTETENSPTPAAAASSAEDISSTGSQTLMSSLPVKCEKISDTVAGGSSTESQELVEITTMAYAIYQPPDVLTADTMDAPPSQPSTSCDEDTMDLDQLKREKLKMQIRVLRLQEKYFALKTEHLKK